MSLPELEWQFIYGRLAWALVLAALLAALWPRAWQLARSTIVFLLIGTTALVALPNEASVAYWLGLAFQWPSGLLVGLCLVRLHSAWQGERSNAAMPLGLAALIVLTGAILYLEAMGLISLSVYYWGFGPHGAPLAALILAVACSVAAVVGRARPQGLALLLAVVMFSVLRLPTGNLWDALCDPLLWGWALVSMTTGCWRGVRTRWG